MLFCFFIPLGCMESNQSGGSGPSFCRFRFFETDLYCGSLSTRRKLYKKVQSKRGRKAVKLKVNHVVSLFVEVDDVDATSLLYKNTFIKGPLLLLGCLNLLY